MDYNCNNYWQVMTTLFIVICNYLGDIVNPSIYSYNFTVKCQSWNFTTLYFQLSKVLRLRSENVSSKQIWLIKADSWRFRIWDYVSGKVCWIWDFWVYYKTETHHWNFAFTISSVLQIQFHRKDKLCVMIVLVDLPAECDRILYVFFFTYW